MMLLDCGPARSSVDLSEGRAPSRGWGGPLAEMLADRSATASSLTRAPYAAEEADGLQKTFHAITLGVSAGYAESSDDGGLAGHMVAGMDDSTTPGGACKRRYVKC